jgi:hypothetical protein
MVRLVVRKPAADERPDDSADKDIENDHQEYLEFPMRRVFQQIPESFHTFIISKAPKELQFPRIFEKFQGECVFGRIFLQDRGGRGKNSAATQRKAQRIFREGRV